MILLKTKSTYEAHIYALTSS